MRDFLERFIEWTIGIPWWVPPLLIGFGLGLRFAA
jgi:hypothetical protein